MTTTRPRITFADNRYWLDGRTLPRVSDILNVINKPGLHAWRQRVGTTEADAISKTATDLGTAVHAACETVNRMLLSGTPLMDIAVDEFTLSPYLAAYRRFLVSRVKRVLLVEARVFHEEARYAGTLDVAYELVTGETALGDLKTGKTVDYTTTPLQLAAYSLAARSMGVLTADRRIVIHLPSDRPGKVFEHDVTDDDERLYDLGWWAAVRLHRHYERSKDGWRTEKGTAR